MELSEKFKYDIKKYFKSKGYDNAQLFYNGVYLIRSYFYGSKKGEIKRLKQNWIDDIEYYDKYLLEFLSPILIKHNITEIKICDDQSGTKIIQYTSTNWEFKTIK